MLNRITEQMNNNDVLLNKIKNDNDDEQLSEQRTVETITNYFNEKEIYFNYRFLDSTYMAGNMNEKIEVPFIIKNYEIRKITQMEVLFNVNYIAENYTNLIMFCAKFENYLKELESSNKDFIDSYVDFIFKK